MTWSYYCISARRPLNVTPMEKFGADLIWVVPNEEVPEYEAAGAVHTLGVVDVDGNNLVASRNIAIEHAQEAGEWCIQISDDLRRLSYYDGEEKRPLDLPTAAGMMVNQGLKHSAELVGVSPTANAYFFRNDFSVKNFIVGDLIAISPDCTLRFDPQCRLKEDYDYTLQHLQEHGIALRVNRIMAEFRHRSNRGGAVTFRHEALEQEVIAYLKRKWPNHVRDNARRPNEILIRW